LFIFLKCLQCNGNFQTLFWDAGYFRLAIALCIEIWKKVAMPTLLWWGRSDLAYSRNQIILQLLDRLGWHVDYFHPLSSPLGLAQAWLQRPRIPDLLWVPCFRQRDMASAVYWARQWRRPVVFDPLISAYQKAVFEKKKWPENHAAAVRMRSWEAGLFGRADAVIADTHPHAQFYIDTFRIDPGKVWVVHVGADDQRFKPATAPKDSTPLEVLFYGSFLALQGPDVIVAAARETEDQNIRWVLLGSGGMRSDLAAKARGLSNVRFEPWIPYDLLPQRLIQAHILLGIFGTTPKAAMVIPNKVYQSMAVGRPLITRTSEAYRPEVRNSDIIGWVPPGDARALADCVLKWARDPRQLMERGRQTRGL
jgi:glycosyltransferase involved in cell wall biosynthesis